MSKTQYQMSKKVSEWFQQEIDNNTERQGSCLIWTGAYSRDGYGRYNVVRSQRQPEYVKQYLDRINVKWVIAPHRLAYLIDGGWFNASKKLVRHQCSQKGCCEVNHLVVGDDADNYHDAVKRGERLQGGYSRRDTPDHIKEYIRSELRDGRSAYSVAKELGMYINTIICYRDAMIKQGVM